MCIRFLDVNGQMIIRYGQRDFVLLMLLDLTLWHDKVIECMMHVNIKDGLKQFLAKLICQLSFSQVCLRAEVTACVIKIVTSKQLENMLKSKV